MHEYEPNEEESAVKYLAVLLETFPDPISRASLAEKVGVSKAAITKQREALYEVCNKKEFAFRGLVLEESKSVAAKIAWMFLANKRFSTFIESAYCRAIISKLDLHANITKSYPPYGYFFTPEDTALMVQTVLARLVVFDQIQIASRKIIDPEERAYLLSMRLFKLLPIALDSLQIRLKAEADLKRWLSLRDRCYFFLEYVILERVKALDILKEIRNPESYLEVYKHTVQFYLEKAFEIVTTYLESQATTSKIPFKKNYRKLGAFFRPQGSSSTAPP